MCRDGWRFQKQNPNGFKTLSKFIKPLSCL